MHGTKLFLPENISVEFNLNQNIPLHYLKLLEKNPGGFIDFVLKIRRHSFIFSEK